MTLRGKLIATFLLGAVAVLCAFSVAPGVFSRVGVSARKENPVPPVPAASRSSVPEPPVASGATDTLGQFPANTDAERELERMLSGKDEDIDLALANWLIAADLPQFADMTREWYFQTLDTMTKEVRLSMENMSRIARSEGANPKDPDTLCGIFCNAIIKLRFAYTEEFRSENLTLQQMAGLYSNANNILLAGLLRTRRGSCVSMPLIYLVIGQRLGMPVHLVTVGKHYFIRWEEPGYRMNIETTSVDKVRVTPDDSVYLETEGMTPEQVKGSAMRNQTRREVVGCLFFARSGYWEVRGTNDQTQTCIDLSRAFHLAPEDPAIQTLHQRAFAHYGIKPEHRSIKIIIKPKA